MPQPVNIKRDDCDLYCGRNDDGDVPDEPGEPGWLGNPIARGRTCPVCSDTHTEAGSTLECYEDYLRRRLAYDGGFRKQFYRKIAEDTRLGCFCKPDPCHTDVIAEVWEESYMQNAAKTYTGVGSRDTPERICELMTNIAKGMARLGWTLRSGAAEGADTAFEEGADAREIYLPWDRYNNRDVHAFSLSGEKHTYVGGRSVEAREVAAEAHPAWDNLSGGAQKLHGRNANQVLGPDMTSPSARLICWTPDGAETAAETSRSTGGTGQAIRIADRFDVPVHNLAREVRREGYGKWLRESA